jgi:hypothetical protein
MMKRHCDICDDLALNPEAHVWANQLEATHPLREVSATITFHSSRKDIAALIGDAVDLCETCFGTWVRGLAAAHAAPTPPPTHWWVVTGRVDGDDEDTLLTIEADDEDAAHVAFHDQLRNLHDSADDRPVYINHIVNCGTHEPVVARSNMGVR